MSRFRWSRAKGRLLVALVLVPPLVGASGCDRAALFGRFATKTAAQLTATPRKLPQKIADPRRPDARIAITWIGHATMLVQIDDAYILTDPVFTDSVGGVSVRLVEPGLDVASLPPLDAVVVSHLHFDHLSTGSLEQLGGKIKRLYVPAGGAEYVPIQIENVRELDRFEACSAGGLTVTAVPVDHVGFRYGADAAWMPESFTGYVFEKNGLTVYFAGDTAYAPALFRATRARFPSLDLALLPIAPIHPRDFMQRTHMDPDEALRAFVDLGAKRLIPMHFDTFVNSTDAAGEARERFVTLVRAQKLGEEVVRVLPIGGQAVIVPRP